MRAIFAKIVLALFFPTDFREEFLHGIFKENVTDGLVSDTNSQTDGRTKLFFT